MRNILIVLALTAAAAACGEGADKGPAEEEMKAAASRLLQVPEAKITQFTKEKCKARGEGFVCTFEMYIAFGETPTRQELKTGYFFKSGDAWVMELEG